MATSDRREGRDADAPREAAAPPGDAGDARTADPAPSTGDPPAAGGADAGRGGLPTPVESWSHLADLDEPAAGRADGASADDEAFRTGGLLGVDSGLLRILEAEGTVPPAPAPPPDPGSPGEAVPASEGGDEDHPAPKDDAIDVGEGEPATGAERGSEAAAPADEPAPTGPEPASEAGEGVPSTAAEPEGEAAAPASEVSAGPEGAGEGAPSSSAEPEAESAGDTGEAPAGPAGGREGVPSTSAEPGAEVAADAGEAPAGGEGAIEADERGASSSAEPGGEAAGVPPAGPSDGVVADEGAPAATGPTGAGEDAERGGGSGARGAETGPASAADPGAGGGAADRPDPLRPWLAAVAGEVVRADPVAPWAATVAGEAAAAAAAAVWPEPEPPRRAPLAADLDEVAAPAPAGAAPDRLPWAAWTPPPEPDPALDRLDDDLLFDTWGGDAEDVASSAAGERPSGPGATGLLPPLAPPDRLQELDPFAAPVSAGLPDELEGLDDPFDSISALPAPLSIGHAEGAPVRPPAAPSAGDEPPPEPEPPSLPGAAPAEVEAPVAAEADAIRLPDAAEVAAARALLATRSRARREALVAAARDADILVVEEIVHDSDERRVIRTEYPSLEELAVEEVVEDGAPDGGAAAWEAVEDAAASMGLAGDEPPAAHAPDGAEAEPPGGILVFDDDAGSALARLSREPLDLPDPDEPPPASAPAPATAAPSDPPAEVTPGPDAEGLPVDVRPSWGGVEASETPPPDLEFDAERLARSGVPFLGAIPRFAFVDGAHEFPPGSLATVEPTVGAGPPVVPDLPTLRAGAEPWLRALMDRLAAEIRADVDRRRLALLLHEVGLLARDHLDDEDLALSALRAAQTNDPGFRLNRWALHEMLLDLGRPEEVVAHLARRGAARAEADGLYRAGHLAAAALHDADRAAGLLQRAAEAAPGALAPLLARYLLHLAQLDWEAALSVLEAAVEAAESPTLGGLLLLDAARLREELGAAPDVLAGLHRRALERIGGAPALLASVERHVAEHGGLELLLAALRARFDAVRVAFEAGELPEAEAKREIGEVFYKAGWALERLGRRAEALREYQNALQTLPNDPYVLYRAAELARRLGRPAEQRAILERMAALARDPAEAANALYQMGLVAQQILADEARAAADFERAVAALPTFTPALAALGRLAIKQGRWDEVHDRFAAEIAQLEEALRGDQPPAERARTIRGLLSRYHRAARVLEERLEEPEAAIAYHKRALALAPDFLPAFFDLERLYEQAGRWRALVALNLGLVERLARPAADGAPPPIDPVPFLLRAAEVLRVRLGDDLDAGRVYARALARAPDHRATLRAAADVFARLGDRAARVEVEARWARTFTAPEGADIAAALFTSAGQLQELDGDPLAAAAEALPLFREALRRRPDLPDAFDGLLRADVRLGRAGELVAHTRDPAVAERLPALLLLPAAEAMIAAGRFDAAAEVLQRWRDRLATERGALPVAVEEAADRAALALLEIAHERAEAWRPLADVLEERAARTSDPGLKATLLVRVGELWEHRLDEPDLAGEAYARALEAAGRDAPAAAGAREGLERLATRRGDSGGPGAARARPAALLRAARAARRAGDAEGAAALEAAIEERAATPDEAAAARRLARPDAPDDDAIRRAFEARPDRRDRFEAWLARLGSPSAAPEAWLDALRRRLPHEDDAGRAELLTSALGLLEETGDAEEIRSTAKALLALEPTSVPAALALYRLAQSEGDAAARLAAGERLAGLLQSPRRAAAVYRELAAEAEQSGEGTARVRALLEEAVHLDPTGEEAGAALEALLHEAGDWPDLLELYDRRLVATTDPATLRRLQLAKARLLDERLDDPRGALRCCEAVLEQAPQDLEAARRAADLAERLGDRRRALELLARAAEGADTPDDRADIAVRRGALLHAEGETAAARDLLEAAYAEQPRRRDVLALLADVRAAARDWTGVVEALRRLYALEETPAERADRARALGEILARVHGEHRLAAGWFKRAVELDPGRLEATWRLLEEAEHAPAGAVPVEHVADALDRALAATRERLAADPFDAAVVADLAGLLRARGDTDGWYVACGALVCLGAAGPEEAEFYRFRRERVAVDFGATLDEERRRALLVHPGETGPTASLFAPFALVLTELLAERMPPGATRLSGRSYARWQANFRQIAAGLDLVEVEVWQSGRREGALRGRYLPRPAVEVPTALLEQGIDARQAFRLGRLLDGLRDGRLLLLVHGPAVVGRCVAAMAVEVAPDAARAVGLSTPDRILEEEAADADLRARLADRARRLPRRFRLMLDALRTGAGAVDFDAYARAIRATGDRAGLLAAGDLGVALDELLGEAGGRDGTPADRVAALRALPEARQLMTFALGPAYLELRRALGLAVTP